MTLDDSTKLTDLLRRTNADKILSFLESISPQAVSNAEIVARTGVRPHQQVFQITQRLSRSGTIHGRRFGHEWQFWTEGASTPS